MIAICVVPSVKKPKRNKNFLANFLKNEEDYIQVSKFKGLIRIHKTM